MISESPNMISREVYGSEQQKVNPFLSPTAERQKSLNETCVCLLCCIKKSYEPKVRFYSLKVNAHVELITSGACSDFAFHIHLV